jgi:hypothetical protein
MLSYLPEGALVLRMRHPTNTSLFLTRLENIDVQAGNVWKPIPVQGDVGMLPRLSLHLEYLPVTPPPNTERMRVTLAYWKGAIVGPLGIGDYRARIGAPWTSFRPPGKTSECAQKAVKFLSDRLYDRLWPPPPNIQSIEWKTNTFELKVPKISFTDFPIQNARL